MSLLLPSPTPRRRARPALPLLALLAVAGCGGPPSVAGGAGSPARAAASTDSGDELVMLGRQLVITRDCGACHGGWVDPTTDGWLAGRSGEEEVERVGPFRVWPANLTPDVETGIGRYTERQIFNALRYGLRPSATPDVEVTSPVPGQGNHPARPSYLAPAMPWVYMRYMSDRELQAIAAYLKRGVAPVRHRVPDPEGPPDGWASATDRAVVGGPTPPPFPAATEVLHAPERREEVLRGRELVLGLACGACHGGIVHPGQERWLIGSWPGAVPYEHFDIGPFKTYPRNLTPDNATGLGRFSERQIFNALRYGLRPGETPDVEITSPVPGQGNHPANPKYLAPPMPWPAYRHLADAELRAIAAYLKQGLRPVANRVADSDGPPDFWVSEYTVDKTGAYPAPAFPTARERRSR